MWLACSRLCWRCKTGEEKGRKGKNSTSLLWERGGKSGWRGERTGGGYWALLGSLSLRALSVECSGSDRAVRVRWLLSLIRPAHSRSSNQARCSATSKVELQSARRTPRQVLRVVYVQREEGDSAVYSHRLLQSSSSSWSLPARHNKDRLVDFTRT